MRYKVLILGSLIFLTGSSIDISAARYITVATIGTTPSLDQSQDPQSLVNQVIAFWKKELKQVVPDKPDLIVLPEFCDLSGAGDEYLRVRKNQVLDYFASVAAENRCYIAFGMKRQEPDGTWRNSCVILNRQGKIGGIYDKNFPTIEEMKSGIKAGNVSPLISCDFGRVAVVVCFDLNFDELRERYAKENPDLIIFSSMYHGGLVQGNWAYTLRAYFVSSVYRENPSEIRNPLGEVVSTTSNYTDFTVSRINIDCKLVHLDYNQDKLTALKEKYGAAVKITDPGRLASVLVTSEDKNITADQMIEEFDIELLEDYLNRSRDFRSKAGNNK